MAKMADIVEMVLPIMGMISPDGSKARFHSLLYPFAVGFTQVAMFFTPKIALNTSWQTVNFYSAGILLLAALVCVVVIHNKRFGKKMPFIYIDWVGLLFFGTALISMAYVFSFGKQQDWFNSPTIIYATVISIISIAALIVRELNIKRPLLLFKHYPTKEILLGVFLLVGQGMYMASGSIMSIFTQATLGYNWVTNASLNLMMLPGIMAAGFAAFHWTRNHLPIKMLIFSGFAAYFLFTVMLYLMMTPGLNITQLYLPQMLQGYGMTVMFSSIWIYTFNKIPRDDALPSVAPIMVFRSFVILGFFTALYTWVHYQFQWQSVGDHAVYFDALNMSHNPGVGAYGSVQMSAILAANKRLLGYINVAGLGFLIFILNHSFGMQKYRLMRYRMRQAERQKIAIIQQNVSP
jgi:hypothetical protein